MKISRFNLYFVLVMIFLTIFLCANGSRQPRTIRATLRALGLGPWCVGCPVQYCDDDPNIIQGYCCGCARFVDSLPVECSLSLKCPLNTYHLCRRYEYMMHCCC